MDIFLSINNREQVLKLPVLPASFRIISPHNNQVYNTISQGDIKLIGNRGLKGITIQSFFPAQEYPFLRDNIYGPWEYVEIIESWIDRRVPIRITITDTPINMPVSIENFEYGIADGTKDIYYSLDLEQFKFVKVQAVT